MNFQHPELLRSPLNYFIPYIPQGCIYRGSRGSGFWGVTKAKAIQGWAEVSDRFSNRCGLKLVHATPIKFQTLDYQRVLCLFWKFEAFILKQNWFMIKNRIYFLFQKIEFSTLNSFKENQMFFNKRLLNFIQTEIFCVKLSFLNGQQIW